MTAPTGLVGGDIGGQIGGALASIGRTIGQLIDPGREERDRVEQFLLSNPEIGQQFAAAQREQERQFFDREVDPDIAKADVEGVATPTPPNVLGSFGFNTEQTEQALSLFPESQQERLDIFRRKAGLERIQVESELAQFQQQISESNLANRLALARSREGIPEEQAQAESFELALKTELNNNQRDHLRRWNAYVATLSPFERQRALIAEASPEFLQDLQFREALAVRKNIAEIQASIAALGDRPSALDLFKINLDAQGNLDTQLDRFREALESGSEEDKAVALQRINEAAALVRATGTGGLFAVDPGGRRFITGRLKGFRVTRLAPGTLAVPLALQYEQLLGVFEAADPTILFNQLQAQLMQDPQGAAFLGSLTPRELQKFWADAQAQLGSLAQVEVQSEEEAEITERRAAEAGVVEERATSIVGIEEELSTIETELETFEPGQFNEPRVIVLRRRMNRLKLDLRRLKTEAARARPPLIGVR